jgi:hypothetical protein
MTDINPTIIEVAKIYGFNVEYREEENETIISTKKHEFYWNSRYESQVSFWETVATYFEEKGYSIAARW